MNETAHRKLERDINGTGMSTEIEAPNNTIAKIIESHQISFLNSPIKAFMPISVFTAKLLTVGATHLSCIADFPAD